MFCCAVCDKNLHPGGHIYSVPEETIPGDFVWNDGKTIDWCTCLLWVFLKICLSSLIRLPGHLAAHNSRSCGSGVHLKMSRVRIGLVMCCKMYPHPYSQTLLRIVRQEDAGNYSHQVEGEVRNLKSMETIKWIIVHEAQVLNLGRVFVPISHWKAWGDHVGIVDCFNLQ